MHTPLMEVEESSLSSFSSSFPKFEAGVSANTDFSCPHSYSRNGSYTDMEIGFFLDDLDCEEHQHFLDACALCKKPLRSNRDIYMYRGNTPFCSEECRQERIEMDEALEKSGKLSSIRDQNKSSASSSPKSQEIPVRAGTVVAG